MIDNKELLKPLLTFEQEGDFYFLLVLKRKKDQSKDERNNHQSVRTIKTYCIDSTESLDKRWDEITHLCEYFKARAYIHVMRQNHKDIGLSMLANLASRIRDGVFKHNYLFDSVVGKSKNHGQKLWIVDIDTKKERFDRDIQLMINSCEPQENKILLNVPTKNGNHLITKPFNRMEFDQKFLHKFGNENYGIPDIQKNNPTLLYLPESLT